MASPLAPSGLGAPARMFSIFLNFQLCIERIFVHIVSEGTYTGAANQSTVF